MKEFLQSVSIFNGITEVQLDEVDKVCTLRKYPKNFRRRVW